MNGLSNIGGTFLDVNSGVQMIKNQQRQDATQQQQDEMFAARKAQIAREAETADAGLSDMRKSRAWKAADEQAMAAGGFSAMIDGQRARGDSEGMTRSAIADYNATELAFKAKWQKPRQDAEAKAFKRGVEMQPRKDALEDSALAQAEANDREGLAYRWWQIAQTNPAEAVKLISDSSVAFPGVKISDMAMTADKSQIVFIDDKGKEVKRVPRSYFEALQRARAPAPEIKAVNPGQKLVSVGRDQNGLSSAREMFDNPSPDQFGRSEDGTVFNKKTGAVTGGGGSLSGNSVSQKTQDARFKDLKSMAFTAMGGKLDAMGQMSLPKDAESKYLRMIVLGEQYIKGGMDTGAAADKAYREIEREAKLGPGAAGLSGGAAPTSSTSASPSGTDWNFLVRQ